MSSAGALTRPSLRVSSGVPPSSHLHSRATRGRYENRRPRRHSQAMSRGARSSLALSEALVNRRGQQMAVTTTRPVEEVTSEAQALHDRSIVIDTCSFFLRGYNDRVRSGGLTAINFTVPDVFAAAPDAFRAVREYYEVARRDPKVSIVRTGADSERAKAEGKLGAILGTQNSRFLGTELVLVEMFARLGIRVVQLTYNERNFAGDGWMEPNDAGLSLYGRALIKELARCGIVLDLSHIGRRTIQEAIAASEGPVVVTHAGLKKFVDHSRTGTRDETEKIDA